MFLAQESIWIGDSSHPSFPGFLLTEFFSQKTRIPTYYRESFWKYLCLDSSRTMQVQLWQLRTFVFSLSSPRSVFTRAQVALSLMCGVGSRESKQATVRVLFFWTAWLGNGSLPTERLYTFIAFLTSVLFTVERQSTNGCPSGSLGGKGN